MRCSLFAVALFAGSSSAYNCINDTCQKTFQSHGAIAIAVCALVKEFRGFSPLPSYMEDYSSSRISSACACITATSSSKSSSSSVKTSSTSSTECSATVSTITSVSTVTAAPSTAIIYSTVVSNIIPGAVTVTQYSTVVTTVISLSTIVSTEIDVSTYASTEIDILTLTETAYVTVPTTQTDISTVTQTAYLTVPTTVIVPSTVTAYSTSILVSTVSICPASTDSSTSSSTSASVSSLVTSVSSTSATPVPCTATAFSQVAPAIAACTAITLQDIACPTNKTLPLTGLKAGQVITFAGTTTFAFTNISTFDPISISGVGFTIQGAPGHVIDGNGQVYWDGIGSNGGVPKPSHFVGMTKVTGGVVIKDLNIINYPVHCWSISSSSNVLMTNINLDNSAGNAPTNTSKGLPGGHNSDGFDLSSCNNFTIQNSWVNNQDDCVAVTSGNNITINNMWCNGGHGMSIGSVGGKSNNNVTNIVFSNSVILNSTNGPRIKTNYNTTGFISNITYSNIYVGDVQTYGIDIQQDYLNGGPTGTPTNGVIISNIYFHNVTGTAVTGAQDYYILCGDGSCSNFVFDGVSITGGSVPAACNYPSTGCPGP